MDWPNPCQQYLGQYRGPKWASYYYSYSIITDREIVTYGFKEGNTIGTNVTGWCKTQTTDKTSSQIGQDITIKIWHDQDIYKSQVNVICNNLLLFIQINLLPLLTVVIWVLDNAKADGIQVLILEGDVRVIFSNLTGTCKEKTVSLSHNVGLNMD